MSRYTKELLEPIVKESISFAQVVRKLGLKQAGGTQSHIKSRIQLFNIDTTHFKGKAHGKGIASPKKLTWDQVLLYDRHKGRRERVHLLRRSMLSYGFKHQCAGCGIGDSYNGYPIVLEIDHIDENFINNRPNNLRFLCPNCHYQVTHNKELSKKYTPVVEVR